MAEYEISNGEQAMETQGGDAGPGGKINASKNDDDSRKIFVGGLSWETTVKDLKEYFQKFGDVADCTLKTDPNTGRSRGFGFVLFGDSSSVDSVLSQGSHSLHGRNIDPKRAKARGGREPILKIFVGGVDPSAPESDIREHFEQYGKVTQVDLPFDKMKNQRRPFCFVTFESEEVVDKVCENPKQDVGGKSCDIKKATPKPEQGYGGGFGGGYGGGRGGRGRGGGEGFGPRGRGRGRGGGGYNQGGYGNYGDYYNQGYGNGYGGGYDYSNYYNQGWGGYNQGYGSGYDNSGYDNSGYGSYDYSGWGYGSGQDGGQQSGYGKTRGGASGGGSHGYHPYSR